MKLWISFLIWLVTMTALVWLGTHDRLGTGIVATLAGLFLSCFVTDHHQEKK